MNDGDLREAMVRWLVQQGGSNEPPARLDLGWLGHIFGARYASTNIAGTVIVAALVLLFMDGFGVTGSAGSRELVTGAFSAISLALGYLFGAHTPRA